MVCLSCPENESLESRVFGPCSPGSGLRSKGLGFK